MVVKIVFYTELARIFGKEVRIVIDEGKSVKDLLNYVLKRKNIKFADIHRDYFILVNGKTVKPEHKVEDNDEIHVLPRIMGGAIKNYHFN